jgi:hypothetical protein
VTTPDSSVAWLRPEFQRCEDELVYLSTAAALMSSSRILTVPSRRARPAPTPIRGAQPYGWARLHKWQCGLAGDCMELRRKTDAHGASSR